MPSNQMIDNPRSPRVRAVAKLAKRDARSQTGLFLLEGPQSVTEALTFRPELVVELFATPTALERYTELAQAAVDAGVDIEFVTEDVLSAMADTVTPQGLVAVCRQFPTSIKDIFGSSRAGFGSGSDSGPGSGSGSDSGSGSGSGSGDSGGSPRLIAILEEVRDPGNAGTIIRAADAAGADAVIMTGRSVDLYNPKVVRATTGSLFHVPVAVGIELPAVLARCAAAGLQVLAADVKGSDLLTARREGLLAAPTAWLFGNEARGLTDEHLALAERAIVVPIYGHAESMNLATAASVCLYESAFAQH